LIIDCHTHLNRYEHDQPPSTEARLELLRGQMFAHGITHALVLTSYTTNENRPSLDEVVELLDDDPEFSVIGGIDFEGLGRQQLRRLEEHLEAERIRGLKLYPGYQRFDVRSRRLHPVYELAAEHGVPVMVHTGDTFAHTAKVRYTHPLLFDELAVDCRLTTFVLCHMGNPWFVDATEVVYKNENVFADVSGFTLGAFEPRYERLVLSKMNDAIAFINDPGKLLFGTDWPICEMGSYLDFAAKLDMTGEEREGLMWHNAARVFRLPVAPPEEAPRVLAG
jgi:predicted TIM-barrel fold metal-dependent hydrolase